MIPLASSATPDPRPVFLVLVVVLVVVLILVLAAALGVRLDVPLEVPLDVPLDRLPLVFRAFPAFAGIALFTFFMGILLNEGLRGFTKTG
jgi:hypothetical protein